MIKETSIKNTRVNVIVLFILLGLISCEKREMLRYEKIISNESSDTISLVIVTNYIGFSYDIFIIYPGEKDTIFEIERDISNQDYLLSCVSFFDSIKVSVFSGKTLTKSINKEDNWYSETIENNSCLFSFNDSDIK